MVSTIKKDTLESFSECTGISNVVKVGKKSVPGGRTAVEEATFFKCGSCSGQNVQSGPKNWHDFCTP